MSMRQCPPSGAFCHGSRAQSEPARSARRQPCLRLTPYKFRRRPITDADRFLDVAEGSRPAARAVIVLVFWSYFETKIERLWREGMHSIPTSIMEDILRRYSSIGSRLDRLYRLLFETTYWSDLEELGFQSGSRLLQRLQQARNGFAHGHPEAIDDVLVTDLVTGLKDEHEGWIAVFNRRAVGRSPAHS